MRNQSTIVGFEDEWSHEPRYVEDIKELREVPGQQSAKNRDLRPITGTGFCQEPGDLGRRFSPRSIQMRRLAANSLIFALDGMKQRNQLSPPGFRGE